MWPPPPPWLTRTWPVRDESRRTGRCGGPQWAIGSSPQLSGPTAGGVWRPSRPNRCPPPRAKAESAANTDPHDTRTTPGRHPDDTRTTRALCRSPPHPPQHTLPFSHPRCCTRQEVTPTSKSAWWMPSSTMTALRAASGRAPLPRLSHREPRLLSRAPTSLTPLRLRWELPRRSRCTLYTPAHHSAPVSRCLHSLLPPHHQLSHLRLSASTSLLHRLPVSLHSPLHSPHRRHASIFLTSATTPALLCRSPLLPPLTLAVLLSLPPLLPPSLCVLSVTPQRLSLRRSSISWWS